MFTATHLAEALLDITPAGYHAPAVLRRLANRARLHNDDLTLSKLNAEGVASHVLELLLADLRSSTLALAHATEPAAIERACRTLWADTAAGAIVDEGYTWDQLIAGDPTQADLWRTDVRAVINAALAAPTTQEGNIMTKPADTTTDTVEDAGDGPSEFQYLGFLREVINEFPDEWPRELKGDHAEACKQLAKLTGHDVGDDTATGFILEFLGDILANLSTAVPAPDARITEAGDTAQKRLLRLAEDHASQPDRARIYIELADRASLRS